MASSPHDRDGAKEDGLLSRWSRRKLAQSDASQKDKPVASASAESQVRVPAVLPGAASSTMPARIDAAATERPAAVQEVEKEMLPTLDDARRLKLDSDFKPFLARGVSPEVRNVAMKKLFTDPHFNVMDGLDIYIDDYSKPDPLPESMLRQMVSAKFLNLFDDKESEQLPAKKEVLRVDQDIDAEKNVAESASQEAQIPAAENLAPESPAPTNEPKAHADPDLRLQPDHAPAADPARRGAG